MSSKPIASQVAHRDAARSPSPNETPDIIPSRQLTDKEIQKDYQSQIALLREQMTADREQGTGRSPSPEETPDIEPSRILSREEADADYQKQLDLLRQQNAERLQVLEGDEEKKKARL